MEDSLLSLMSVWNVPLRRRMCCPYHAAALQAHSVVKRLAGAPCNRGWRPVGSEQCRDCGVLLTAGMGGAGCCPLCGSEAVQPVQEHKDSL